MEATEKRDPFYELLRLLKFDIVQPLLKNLTTGFKRFRGRKPRRRSGCMGKVDVSGIGLEGGIVGGGLIKI
ncbi:hypothetical protein OUZ56_029521 [Daphnia magna]|uniref:Uncharacterized protein n=1 Tax=Daphnia magna TaxID=35525 RepID=A0ABR0B729_9CRUS|nr:hypothetical protein OUZ56_029521 [Daphnia magna]